MFPFCTFFVISLLLHPYTEMAVASHHRRLARHRCTTTRLIDRDTTLLISEAGILFACLGYSAPAGRPGDRLC